MPGKKIDVVSRTGGGGVGGGGGVDDCPGTRQLKVYIQDTFRLHLLIRLFIH